MRIVTREQAQKIDIFSQKRFALKGADLMEEAGQQMAQYLLNSIREGAYSDRVVVVAGSGNNGGDALVIARCLIQSEVSVDVYIPENADFSELMKLQMERLKKMGVVLRGYSQLPSIPSSGVVVDGIFGVGLNRDVEGEFAKAIDWINSRGLTVVSVDVPSGLNCNTGGVFGRAVKASTTLMVSPLKVGAFLRRGPELCGHLRSVKIGFAKEAVAIFAKDTFLMEPRHARAWIPVRGAAANKSKFGHCYILAGSEGKWGAAVLSLRSAFRSGAGYVIHSSVGSSSQSEVLRDVPEAMSVASDKLMDEANAKSLAAVAVGPGAGFSKELLKLIADLRRLKHPVVLDADALTLLSQSELRLPKSWILTPHSGELARLTKLKPEEVEADPISAAQYAQRKYGCTIVLKGLYTVVVSGYSGRVVIVPRGNVALAKAGTGDVLTGLIGGYLAQGLHPVKAALLGVWVHGSAADHWVRRYSKATLSASDLIRILPRSLKLIEGG